MVTFYILFLIYVVFEYHSRSANFHNFGLIIRAERPLTFIYNKVHKWGGVSGDAECWYYRQSWSKPGNVALLARFTCRQIQEIYFVCDGISEIRKYWTTTAIQHTQTAKIKYSIKKKVEMRGSQCNTVFLWRSLFFWENLSSSRAFFCLLKTNFTQNITYCSPIRPRMDDIVGKRASKRSIDTKLCSRFREKTWVFRAVAWEELLV